MPEQAEFIISLSYEVYINPEEVDQGKKKNPKGGQQKKQEKRTTLVEDFGLCPFFCPKEKIKLRKGESQVIALYFMPVVLENYKCKVLLALARVLRSGRWRISVRHHRRNDHSGNLRRNQNHSAHSS